MEFAFCCVLRSKALSSYARSSIYSSAKKQNANRRMAIDILIIYWFCSPRRQSKRHAHNFAGF